MMSRTHWQAPALFSTVLHHHHDLPALPAAHAGPTGSPHDSAFFNSANSKASTAYSSTWPTTIIATPCRAGEPPRYAALCRLSRVFAHYAFYSSNSDLPPPLCFSHNQTVGSSAKIDCHPISHRGSHTGGGLDFYNAHAINPDPSVTCSAAYAASTHTSPSTEPSTTRSWHVLQPLEAWASAMPKPGTGTGAYTAAWYVTLHLSYEHVVNADLRCAPRPRSRKSFPPTSAPPQRTKPTAPGSTTPSSTSPSTPSAGCSAKA